jgi:amino acid adenylation domain-containing protein
VTLETERTLRQELSPAKRLLLERRLHGAGKNLVATPATIPRQGGDAPAVLSFAQRRLWFAQQLAAHSPLYHISSAWRIQGDLDRARLEQSLRAVVARHESLRTRFLCRDGEPFQVVDASPTVSLRAVDLGGQSADEQRAEIQRLLKEEITRPFDLSAGVLLRALLVKLHPADHTLLITVHHLVADGWSMGVLARELVAFYDAFASGRQGLPELPIQYRDFAVWQHQRMQGDVLQEQLEWWKAHLAGAPDFLDLPTDRPRPPVQSFRGRCRWKTFPGPMSDALRTLSHREGATLFMTLLAAFQILLHRLTGQADILIGTPVAGRDRSETEGLIGLFVNMLVLRSQQSGNPTFLEFLRHTREETLEAYARQDLPFEKLVEELRPERKSSYSPLIQVVFALQPAPDPLPTPDDLTVTLIPERDVDTGTAKFDLTFNMQDDGQELSAFVEYNSDVFEEATIDRMLSHFEVLLEGVVRDPNQTVAALPSIFVLPPAQPLNANGKIDRQALRARRQAVPDQREFVVPRDETEVQLAGIWEELLGVHPIGALDNFFELGGHSLLAMRLLARVEKTFGKPLPVSAVFQSPTLQEFAGFIRNGTPKPTPAASSIVKIQPEGTKPPLFLIHGAGGGMLWGYTNLSRYLGVDQPVYGFKARELNGPDEFSAIEEMAAEYLSDLRQCQPRGPYYLGGYCFGGNVAWEMARQLQEQGERAALVVLMNSAPTHSSRARIAATPAWVLRFLGNLCYLTACFLRRPFAQQRRFIAWRAGAMVRRVAHKLGGTATTLRMDADELVDLSTFPSEQRPLWEAHIRALVRHRTQPYAGRVTLLRSRAHPFWCSFDRAYDWGEFVSQDLDIRIVPGAHEQILEEPHVQRLAHELREILNRARQEESYASAMASPDRENEEAEPSKHGETNDAESAPAMRGQAEFNGPAADYPRDQCVHHLFEEQVARTPDAVAVIYNHEQLTYREIDNRAHQLARTLQKLGVGPDVPVGISLPRSPAMIVGVLAILKAGGAYVPLDPAYPHERLRLMIETARIPVLLTQTSLCGHFQLPSVDCRLLCVDAPDFASGGTEPDSRWADGKVQPRHLAYVIHTSGSTGTPKGVAMPHGPLVNLIAWQLRNSSMAGEARTLQFASLSFDVSFQEMFSTWCAGGTLVLVDEETRRDPAALLNFILEQRIERLFLPFVALQQLAEASCEQTLFPACLREVITAGEQLQVTPGLVRMFERLPAGTLHNHYGPSETHVVTAFTLNGPPSQWPVLPPIGKPIANTQIHLLDEERRPVTDGAEGEIYIGGDCLARGYLHRPELTAEKFVPDPFQDNGSSARLYKTGDLGRRRQDGEIEFLGRIDHQVKIRGFRIELGEIEAAVRQHPDVRETVVLLREDRPGDKRLVAYFVARTDEAANPEELRGFLKQKLPEYMVPSVFVLLEALPLTPSGKVDRKQLPAPPQDRPAGREEFVAPRDVAEEQLVKIWEEVLNVRPIGVRDQFFESGGHSLLAARVVAQIEKTFGQKLSVAALFQSPTVAQLAKLLRERDGQSPPAASSIVGIQPKGSKRPLFLVHGAGGGMFWGYVNLSRHLGTDQPIYAFNSRGLDGLEEFETIEELAEHYVTDLRAFQPNGPYLLGGYCFGGNVAYEIARRLEAQGEKVALLAVFNAWPPNSSYTHPAVTPMFCLKFLRNLRYWAGYVLRLKPRQQRELLLWKLRSIGRKSLRFASRLRATAPSLDVAEWVDLSAQPEDRHSLWAAHIRAYLKHRPQPFPGHLTLFRTRCHPLFCSFDDACGWRELAGGGVTVHLVPGAHESVLDEPHVAMLARELERELAAASMDQPGQSLVPSPHDATRVRANRPATHEPTGGLVPEDSHAHQHS